MAREFWGQLGRRGAVADLEVLRARHPAVVGPGPLPLQRPLEDAPLRAGAAVHAGRWQARAGFGQEAGPPAGPEAFDRAGRWEERARFGQDSLRTRRRPAPTACHDGRWEGRVIPNPEPRLATDRHAGKWELRGKRPEPKVAPDLNASHVSESGDRRAWAGDGHSGAPRLGRWQERGQIRYDKVDGVSTKPNADRLHEGRWQDRGRVGHERDFGDEDHPHYRHAHAHPQPSGEQAAGLYEGRARYGDKPAPRYDAEALHSGRWQGRAAWKAMAPRTPIERAAAAAALYRGEEESRPVCGTTPVGNFENTRGIPAQELAARRARRARELGREPQGFDAGTGAWLDRIANHGDHHPPLRV